ncbi:MAG: hypothetical protein KQ78_02240 [Candidatus Izimaplasma bacterium HR2]|nr:MAG: hypothetical protein KQ78_02240 [Candidatus Izimaplasma bacterium HR2]
MPKTTCLYKNVTIQKYYQTQTTKENTTKDISVIKISDYDVYCAFRRAQANAAGRGYRLPQDWGSFKEKMAKQNSEWLYKATVYFNTTYSNIDLDGFMSCGFELWKGFTYKHFCDRRVLELYIQKDKIKKRKLESTHVEITNSFKFIEEYLTNKPHRSGYSQLQNFCKFREGEVRNIISIYNRGKIDTMTIMYCLVHRYLIMTDDERTLMPYISQRYRELSENLKSVMEFIKEEELKLNE